MDRRAQPAGLHQFTRIDELLVERLHERTQPGEVLAGPRRPGRPLSSHAVVVLLRPEGQDHVLHRPVLSYRPRSVPLTNNVGADQPNRTSRGPPILGPGCSRKPVGSTPALSRDLVIVRSRLQLTHNR